MRLLFVIIYFPLSYVFQVSTGGYSKWLLSLSIDCLVYQMVNNAYHKFPESGVMSSKWLVSWTSCPKTLRCSRLLSWDEENQQKFIYEKREPVKFIFALCSFSSLLFYWSVVIDFVYTPCSSSLVLLKKMGI